MYARRRTPVPLSVRRILGRLGADVRDARRLRRIPTATMAERAMISRTTLHKVERGEPGVSMGAYATVLFVLGIDSRLAELASLRHDEIGRDLADDLLPQRIRARRVRAPADRD